MSRRVHAPKRIHVAAYRAHRIIENLPAGTSLQEILKALRRNEQHKTKT